jgi:pimeloyl-ACP methyl ester carboxylesterase
MATPSKCVPSEVLIPRASFRTVEADGVRISYRESGPADGPVVLLLHGFPSSSHIFRELIPRRATRYRVIAPDLPSFGFARVPVERDYKYSFDALARTVEAFVTALGLEHYARAGRLSAGRCPPRTGDRPCRRTETPMRKGSVIRGLRFDVIGRRQALRTARGGRRNILTFEGTCFQYAVGVPNPERIAPESYTLDAALLERPGIAEMQLALFLDYASNVKLYPEFQGYFRDYQPQLLAIWGKHDPLFIPAGAAAYRRDNPNATVEMLDTAHFALETHVEEIAAAMHQLLSQSAT